MAKRQELPLPGKKPSHRIYFVKGDQEDATWLEIGAAWQHRDGLGFGLSCDAIPLQGRIVMRAIVVRDAEDKGAQQ